MKISDKLSEIWKRLDEHSAILNMLYNPQAKNGLFVELKRDFSNHLKHHRALEIVLVTGIIALVIKLVVG